MDQQAHERFGMNVGNPDIKSAGRIAFGPDDVLFVADNASATIWALDVADGGPGGSADAFDLEGLDAALSAYLGCSSDDVKIQDMAVHPRTHNVYLSVIRGAGDAATPVIIRIDHRDGSLSEVALESVASSSIALANAPEVDDERTVIELVGPGEGMEMDAKGVTLYIALPPRTATVTDMAYTDGTLLVAGMSNEEFASNLRRIAFPFGNQVDNSLEIFHVSHGKWETEAPIRTFVPYEGGTSILASYTCTPVVYFPLDEMDPGTKTVGRTVLELGSRNQPLDMVSYTQGGEEYLLLAHSRHPMTKIKCSDIDGQEALTEPTEPVGAAREELDVPGVQRLANLNGEYVLALQRDEAGSRSLHSLKTASL